MCVHVCWIYLTPYMGNVSGIMGSSLPQLCLRYVRGINVNVRKLSRLPILYEIFITFSRVRKTVALNLMAMFDLFTI